MYQAVESESLTQVNILLENSADPNICKKDGTSPLHLAVEKNNFQIVETLLKYKADPNLKNLTYQQTPVHIAVILSVNISILYLLVEHNGSLTQQDRHCKSPVDYADTDEMKDAIKKLKIPKEAHQLTPQKSFSIVGKSNGLNYTLSYKKPYFDVCKDNIENFNYLNSQISLTPQKGYSNSIQKIYTPGKPKMHYSNMKVSKKFETDFKKSKSYLNQINSFSINDKIIKEENNFTLDHKISFVTYNNKEASKNYSTLNDKAISEINPIDTLYSNMQTQGNFFPTNQMNTSNITPKNLNDQLLNMEDEDPLFNIEKDSLENRVNLNISAKSPEINYFENLDIHDPDSIDPIQINKEDIRNEEDVEEIVQEEYDNDFLQEDMRRSYPFDSEKPSFKKEENYVIETPNLDPKNYGMPKITEMDEDLKSYQSAKASIFELSDDVSYRVSEKPQNNSQKKQHERNLSNNVEKKLSFGSFQTSNSVLNQKIKYHRDRENRSSSGSNLNFEMNKFEEQIPLGNILCENSKLSPIINKFTNNNQMDPHLKSESNKQIASHKKNSDIFSTRANSQVNNDEQFKASKLKSKIHEANEATNKTVIHNDVVDYSGNHCYSQSNIITNNRYGFAIKKMGHNKSVLSERLSPRNLFDPNIYQTEILKTITTADATKLHKWLRDINMHEYYDNFLENGLKNIDELIESMKDDNRITYKMIESLDIRKPGHIYTILIKLEYDANLIRDEIYKVIIGNRRSNLEGSSMHLNLRISGEKYVCCGSSSNVIFEEKNKAPNYDLIAWLKKIKLPHLRKHFIHNGFENLKFFILIMFTSFDYKIDNKFLEDNLHIYYSKERKIILDALEQEYDFLSRKVQNDLNANNLKNETNCSLKYEKESLDDNCKLCIIF